MRAREYEFSTLPTILFLQLLVVPANEGAVSDVSSLISHNVACGGRTDHVSHQTDW